MTEAGSALTTLSDDVTIEVSAGAELQVSSLTVANDKVSLTAKVVATLGATLPEKYQPLVTPKIYGYTELGGTPGEPVATDPEKWTRLSDTVAEQTIEVSIGESRFFRVIAGEE